MTRFRRFFSESVSKLLGYADVRVTACYAELLGETAWDEVRQAMAS